MRGIFTPITKLRRDVFTEVARFGYERDLQHTDYGYFYEASYRIIPGERPTYRESVFKERAIIRERFRLALGMKIRDQDHYESLTADMQTMDSTAKQSEMPIVNVIPFACEACPTNTYRVSNNCRKCLAHPCTAVCPVKAISIGEKAAVIDEAKCIRCGRCFEACPYHAILHFGRPCAEACGANAIGSDELGRCKIDREKCVSCGLCIVSCPFGAIADKSEIFQIITAIRNGEDVYAAIAPAFVGQFGPLATPAKVFSALKALGFKDVIEVGMGADLSSRHEARLFVDNVPAKQPFLGTSCCPSWEAFARKVLPGDTGRCISSSSTPMVATGQRIKQDNPKAKVVFIGPCVAKKMEGLEEDVKPYIDFVMTFEEVMGMFAAKHIEISDMTEDNKAAEASHDGRHYAVASSVAPAIAACIKEMEPGREVQIAHADSLADCKKMLLLAKAGKYNGYLLEGMACPGGCVGGPGTLMPIAKAGMAVDKFAKTSPWEHADQNPVVQGKPIPGEPLPTHAGTQPGNPQGV
ncbi:MAG: 4Fe-4S dicluster domain-containing protein [Oscillospiraceae bacterium]|nr:4Fe-4S dicluster domain-containing protein [Oscillospiraceae bacterium]